MGLFSKKASVEPAQDDPVASSAPLRHYLEAKDGNGRWFVVSAWTTEAEAAQARSDYERSEQVECRIVIRPEGDEHCEQDSTDVPEDFSDDDSDPFTPGSKR